MPEPGSARLAEAGGRSSWRDPPPQMGCRAPPPATPTHPCPSPAAVCGALKGTGWVEPQLVIACPAPEARAGHAALSPCKDNEEWKKNESNKSRLGLPCCQHLNQGRDQQTPPFQLGKVGWREMGEENKTQNNSFQTIAFYSMYRARRAEHPRTAAPRGQVRHGHTHTRD